MDYCSSCRRYLNGAFVCPGCGSYSPSLALPAELIQERTAAAATLPEAHDAPESWRDEPELDNAPTSTPAVPVMGGRAARRQRLARLA